MSTASPRAGHATAPKAPVRPASRRRIKAATPLSPVDPGGGNDLHMLLRDLRDVAASHAPGAGPGSLDAF